MDLIETSRLMRTQSNRHTQYPLFIIQEEQEVVKASGCGDYRKYISNDGEQELTVEQYELLEQLQDDDGNIDNDEIVKLHEELDIDDIKDINLFDFREIEFSNEWVYRDDAGFFFTEKACHEHIESNKHHYNKPRSYVISAWRNPEMVATMQMILNLTSEADGLDMPSCYK